jgi:hypothetical protein
MTTSRIKWYPPLDRYFGRFSEVGLEDSVTVGDLLVRFREQEPRLAPFARFDPDDRLAWGLMVLRGNETLKLADRIEPGDELEILVMVEGGIS